MSAIADEIRDTLDEINPDAIIWDGFDEALIGIGERCGLGPVAIYDRETMVEILSEEMTVDEADEYLEFNVIGAYVGEYTPIIVYVLRRDMGKEVFV
jgi:hypothetical protein